MRILNMNIAKFNQFESENLNIKSERQVYPFLNGLAIPLKFIQRLNWASILRSLFYPLDVKTIPICELHFVIHFMPDSREASAQLQSTDMFRKLLGGFLKTSFHSSELVILATKHPRSHTKKCCNIVLAPFYQPSQPSSKEPFVSRRTHTRRARHETLLCMRA